MTAVAEAEEATQYPMLAEYAQPLKTSEREILGRDREINQVLASLLRPELSNVILVAPAGSGKTALVQAVMLRDSKRQYLEVDLTRMIANLANADEMAARLKTLFDEAEQYVRDNDHELVLFIDEFHQVVQLSAAAVEALKPVLAASGSRGIRLIAATTFEEFHKHVAENQPLVERLQRINLEAPSEEVTVSILRNMAETNNLGYQFPDDRLFKLIYEYTDRYIPASSQPRKSLQVLDAMIGWHLLTKRPLDKALLADVLYESRGVNIALRVDATTIKENLDKRVFSQDLATSMLARRLQVCVADLNDPERPMSSMLFVGSTGTGKTELAKQMSQLLFGDNSMIRMDMSEYALDESVERFRLELTRHVWETPNRVLLLDEVEKASSVVIKVLLQVLDDGRLIDKYNREVSFKQTYIVLTTNAGSEVFRTIADYSADDTGSGSEIAEYDPIIRQALMAPRAGGVAFPPELLGRINAIVPFQPLSRATLNQIVVRKMSDLARKVKSRHGVTLMVDAKVLQYLVEDHGETSSDAGGARRAISKMDVELVSEVAEFINTNPKVKNIWAKVAGQLVSDNENIRTSDAYIYVCEGSEKD